MSKLSLSQVVFPQYNWQNDQQLRIAVEKQVNALSEGRITAKYNAATAVPTTGEYQVMDFVPRSNYVTVSSGGVNYISIGWRCSASPLTFVEEFSRIP